MAMRPEHRGNCVSQTTATSAPSSLCRRTHKATGRIPAGESLQEPAGPGTSLASDTSALMGHTHDQGDSSLALGFEDPGPPTFSTQGGLGYSGRGSKSYLGPEMVQVIL